MDTMSEMMRNISKEMESTKEKENGILELNIAISEMKKPRVG